MKLMGSRGRVSYMIIVRKLVGNIRQIDGTVGF